MTVETSKYWNEFYRTWRFAVPSQFAALVATELQSKEAILELGCGNGRDAIFFAQLGHPVLAIDQSEEAVAQNRGRAEQARLSMLRFEHGHAGEPKAVTLAIRKFSERRPDAPLAVYARFFFHAIDDQREENILSELGQTLKAKSRCYFEFRTTKDAEMPKVFGSHYRRYIDLERFIQRCRRAGFEPDYLVQGQGLAKFRDEDPWVGRVILKRV